MRSWTQLGQTGCSYETSSGYERVSNERDIRAGDWVKLIGPVEYDSEINTNVVKECIKQLHGRNVRVEDVSGLCPYHETTVACTRCTTNGHIIKLDFPDDVKTRDILCCFEYIKISDVQMDIFEEVEGL